MFAGNLIAIGQDNLKRMLAASGIVHTGYLIIAVAAVNAKEFTGGAISFLSCRICGLDPRDVCGAHLPWRRRGEKNFF